MPNSATANQPITINAIKFEQNGRVFYQAVVPAGVLAEITQVDVWKADTDPEPNGYQRAASPTRVKKIASYVTAPDAIMPLGGLANARSKMELDWAPRLAFTPNPGEVGSIRAGKLTVPVEALPLWTVDMQHRIAGFRFAIENLGREDLRDFPLSITIADGMPKRDEMTQFEIINTTQQKLKVDLARQILAGQYAAGGRSALHDQSREWEARAAIITNLVRERSSVLADRLMPPNSSKKQFPRAVTKQAGFEKSLKRLIQGPYAARRSDEEMAQLVCDYWDAIAMLWPEAVENDKEHIILRGTGVTPLNRVLPEVIEIARDTTGEITTASMFGVIQNWIVGLGPDYWHRDSEDGAVNYGSSEASFSKTTQELVDNLP